MLGIALLKRSFMVRQSQQTNFNESNETVILEVGKEFTYLCIYLCMSLLLIEKDYSSAKKVIIDLAMSTQAGLKSVMTLSP